VTSKTRAKSILSRKYLTASSRLNNLNQTKRSSS